MKLLQKAQSRCRSLRAKPSDGRIAVVHAFADGPYDRSSFHLAGCAQHVAEVAVELAKGAIEGLLTMPRQKNEESSRHPFVGLVDHVAVMPLPDNGEEESWKHVHPDDTFVPSTPSGWAARKIGNAIERIGVDVHFYGGAHPEGISLATVRREQTKFFQSGSLHDDVQKSTLSSSRIETATVGAPSNFVENYNVRLTAECDRDMARSLTKTLRERDGGLRGVEALTLFYSEGRYEIACNLLQPDIGSVEAIKTKLDLWEEQNLMQVLIRGEHKTHLVETSYRVGTTAEHCLDVLSKSESSKEMALHDEQVIAKLLEFLAA
jgi:glutamate formiminotransferase